MSSRHRADAVSCNLFKEGNLVPVGALVVHGVHGAEVASHGHGKLQLQLMGGGM